MALNLDLVDQPQARQLEWPEHAQVGWHVRREIEQDWQASHEPQQRQRDELAELRSANALLQQRVAALERAMRARVPTGN